MNAFGYDNPTKTKKKYESSARDRNEDERNLENDERQD